MNKKQEIKNRIDLINKGEVPAGYKNSWGYVYPEEWNLSTLNSLCSKVQKKNKENAQLQVLTNSATKGVILQEEYFDRKIVNNENTDGYYIVEAGDFMYNPRISAAAPAGPINRNNLGISGIASPLYSIFRAKQTTNTNFIERYFESSFWHGYMKRVSNQGARHDRLNLLDEDFYKMPIPQPKVEEQEKIAEILSCCDKVIELKESLIEKTRIQNNYILECLYDSFRTNTKYSLQEIAAFRRGSFPQPYNLPEWYDEDNGKPFVQVFDIDDNYMLKKTTKTKISDLAIPKSVFVPKGSLIISIQGSIGRVAITQYDSYVDRTILIFIKFKKDVDKMFLLYALKKLFDYEKEIAPGQTIKTITKEVLSNFKIVLPSMEEQRNFAKIINQINSKINLLEQELEQYKQLKKSLSQLLLTGIVRTME